MRSTNDHRHREPRRLPGILAAALFAAAIGSVGVAEAATCYTANVSTAVVLPDGSVRGPGALKVCLAGMMNPVAGYHEISIDGEKLGRFVGSFDRADGDGKTEVVLLVFLRNPLAQLVLEGYVVARRDGIDAHRLGPHADESVVPDVVTDWQLARRRGVPPNDEGQVLIAAR